MAISKQFDTKFVNVFVPRTGDSTSRPLLSLPACLLAFFLPIFLTSCSPTAFGNSNFIPQSTRPIVKIGLIAPFEGLYRRTGYEGLSAAQMAVADHGELIRASGIDLLVQALDDSAQPARARRAAQKLLVDPAVGAIVGPLAPWALNGTLFEDTDSDEAHLGEPRLDEARLDEAISDNRAPWLLTLPADTEQRGRGAQPGPFFEFPWTQPPTWGESANGAAAPHPFSHNEFVLAVAEVAAQQSVDRLLVEGTRFEPSIAAQIQELTIALDAWTEGAPVGQADGILWLGDPAEGAAQLNRLRQDGWTAPFWFGPWGGDPIVRERSNVHTGIYWAIWQDNHYTSWSENHEPSSPFAYLVYRATERALGQLLAIEEIRDTSDSLNDGTRNITRHITNGEGWEVVYYEMRGDGLSYRFEP